MSQIYIYKTYLTYKNVIQYYIKVYYIYKPKYNWKGIKISKTQSNNILVKNNHSRMLNLILIKHVLKYNLLLT